LLVGAALGATSISVIIVAIIWAFVGWTMTQEQIDAGLGGAMKWTACLGVPLGALMGMSIAEALYRRV
jgi:uncharacterized membrane protein YfcA